MAYEINKRTEADYRWFRFEAPSELLDSLDHNLKIADGVLRFRIFKVDPGAPVIVRRPPPPPPARASAAPRSPRRSRRLPRRLRRVAATRPPLFAGMPSARGRVAPPPLLDWNSTSDFRGVSALAASNVNVVVITGNLTQDPELRHTGGGTAVCELRVAVNSRRKDGQSGQWVDKPNYFNVVVWGAQGENCANYLSQGPPGGGRRTARLARVGGQRRQRQTPGGADRRQHGPVPRLARRLRRRRGGGGNGKAAAASPRRSDVPADTSDFEGAAAGAAAAPKTTSRSRWPRRGRRAAAHQAR